MTTKWRPLTAAERASWSKARPGGALAAITVATGVLTLILVILLLFAARTVAVDGAEALLRGLGAGREPSYGLIPLVSASSILVLLVFAAIVFALTLARVAVPAS